MQRDRSKGNNDQPSFDFQAKVSEQSASAWVEVHQDTAMYPTSHAVVVLSDRRRALQLEVVTSLLAETGVFRVS